MIPQKYKWLETIGTLPKIVQIALKDLGVKEIKGSANNPRIMQMAKNIGVDKIYTSDDKLAWCALAVNSWIFESGKPLVDFKKDRYNLLRARYLLNWGNPVPNNEFKLGDVVIIERGGAGHCFVALAKTPNGNPIGIGGNQSDMVRIDEFDKKRILGVRNLYSIAPPASVKDYIVSSEGKLSTNEA